MERFSFFVLTLIVGCVLCSSDITVSGISSGGFQAVQLHVAFSGRVNGAGIFAAGPFYCSNNNVALALANCMKTPDLISVTELEAITYQTHYTTDTIDNPHNMKGSRVYLFSGTEDTVVFPGVVKKLKEYYEKFVPHSHIKSVFDIPAEHAIVSSSYGNACAYKGSPFINNCGYDGVGEMLTQVMNKPLKEKTYAKGSSLYKFNQSHYFPPTIAGIFASMDDEGYIYVPESCKRNGSTSQECAVHVALHGCEQYHEKIGRTFVNHAGYLEHAEANDIIVIFPQAIANTLNPKGCYDFWGFTGTTFASKFGVQPMTIMNIVDAVQSGEIELQSV
eukprot:TRINITY_DN774109_c0_g1_i1.p1 TRINITY_DN774109_c0_g1~~TRINITY_DN774109_c0_g1_i1.p1  ORF type:complete len:333 (-),score=81.22 TRINITY_DN774109_c0_g1_i1:603-1601(-)